MNQWKLTISIKIGFSQCQKSFHDHIIRRRCMGGILLPEITEYIENNPARRINDCYYKNEIT
ncbi:MAG: hypothetical protein FWF73_00490 [Spirochaetes bacterium]|nr:hypothetical protein [Spirochaetota bacterium]